MLKFKIKHNVTLDPGAFSPPATLLLNPVHTGLIINNMTLPLREGPFPFYPFLQKTQKNNLTSYITFGCMEKYILIFYFCLNHLINIEAVL